MALPARKSPAWPIKLYTKQLYVVFQELLFPGRLAHPQLPVFRSFSGHRCSGPQRQKEERSDFQAPFLFSSILVPLPPPPSISTSIHFFFFPPPLLPSSFSGSSICVCLLFLFPFLSPPPSFFSSVQPKGRLPPLFSTPKAILFPVLFLSRPGFFSYLFSGETEDREKDRERRWKRKGKSDVQIFGVFLLLHPAGRPTVQRLLPPSSYCCPIIQAPFPHPPVVQNWPYDFHPETFDNSSQPHDYIKVGRIPSRLRGFPRFLSDVTEGTEEDGERGKNKGRREKVVLLPPPSTKSRRHIYWSRKFPPLAATNKGIYPLLPIFFPCFQGGNRFFGRQTGGKRKREESGWNSKGLLLPLLFFFCRNSSGALFLPASPFPAFYTLPPVYKQFSSSSYLPPKRDEPKIGPFSRRG